MASQKRPRAQLGRHGAHTHAATYVGSQPHPTTIAAILLALSAAAYALQHEAWVITLPRQQAQFANFTARWEKVWTNATFRKFTAVESPVRGQGICLSLLNFVQELRRRDTTEPVFVFEPDALPFADVDYNLYNWTLILSAGYDIYFLGGHNIHARSLVAWRSKPDEWIPVLAMFGCYGFVIAPDSLPELAAKLSQYCQANRKAYAVDVFLSHCTNAAVIGRLLVDHPKTSYSETWKRFRRDAWAGQRDWRSLKRLQFEAIECP